MSLTPNFYILAALVAVALVLSIILIVLRRPKRLSDALLVRVRAASAETLSLAGLALVNSDWATREQHLLIELASIEASVEKAAAGSSRLRPKLQTLRDLLPALLDMLALARLARERAARNSDHPDIVHVPGLLAECGKALEHYARDLNDANGRQAAIQILADCVQTARERSAILAKLIGALQAGLVAVDRDYCELAELMPEEASTVAAWVVPKGSARRRTNLRTAMRKEIGAISARAGDPRAARHLVRLRGLALDLLARTGTPLDMAHGALAAMTMGHILLRVGQLMHGTEVSASAHLASRSALTALRSSDSAPSYLSAKLAHAAMQIESDMVMMPGSILDMQELAQSLRDAAACIAWQPEFLVGNKA